MSGKTKKDLFAEIEKLQERAARFEKRQIEFQKDEMALSDIIDEQVEQIEALEKNIARKDQIIAEYRLTVFGQAHILTRSLWPKVKESIGSAE